MEEFIQNNMELPNTLDGCSREGYKFAHMCFFSLLGLLPSSILLHLSSDMCCICANVVKKGCAFPLLSFPTHQLKGEDSKDVEKDRDKIGCRKGIYVR